MKTVCKNHKRFRNLLVFCLLFLLLFSGCAAGHIETVHISGQLAEQDLDSLMHAAQVVCEATVLERQREFQVQSPGKSVANFTNFTLRVEKCYRGKAYADEVTVRVPGGTVDRYQEIYTESPKLEAGKSYLLFLYNPGYGGAFNTGTDYYEVLGLAQGIYTADGGRFVPQLGDTITEEEFENALESVADQPVDMDYFRREFIENQKGNLRSGFITQEEYNQAMQEMDVYAKIIG